MSDAAPFSYRDSELFCEGVAMRRIAAEVGTPTYVYSRRELTRAYRAFDGALDGVKHRVCFSVKANSSLGVLSVLAKLGAGADIVSAGELTRWQRAGGDPTRVVFSGVAMKCAPSFAAARINFSASRIFAATSSQDRIWMQAARNLLNAGDPEFWRCPPWRTAHPGRRTAHRTPRWRR